MSTPEEQAASIQQALGRKTKLAAADLQILRENAELLEGHDRKNDYYLFRMQIELIDAIRALDETSSKLVEKTNRLTTIILALTIAAVLLAGIQVLLAVLQK